MDLTPIATDSPLQEILGSILKGVASLVTLGVGWLVTQACLYLKDRKKIDVNDRTKKAILDAAAVGIARGEEWGLQQIKKLGAVAEKEGLIGTEEITPPTGEEKQKVAKETASLISPEFRALDDVAKGAIMDAKLFQMRQVSLLPAVPPSIRPPSRPSPAIDLTGQVGTVPKAASMPRFGDLPAPLTKEGV